VIPHNSQLIPWTVELGRFTARESVRLELGIFISISSNQKNNISRIVHEWDFTSQNSTGTRLSMLEVDMDQPLNLVAFDEDIGRSIHFGRDKMIVVDLVMAG
jgi:hypothetical protein